MTEESKPVIATIINTIAITFTGAATTLVALEGVSWDAILKATFLVTVGGGLEFFKYWGMKQKLW